MPDIIVCLKIIIDPETPTSIFKIDRDNRCALPPKGMPPVISPFDLNALEAALKIKDAQGGRVILLSLGKALPKAIIQKALAMGADEAVAIEDKLFDNLDAFGTAQALVKAIRKIGAFDLICTGRQAADWDGGVVWAGMAELLDIPCVTIARKAEVQNDHVIVERCTSDGIEVLETTLPALVTFTSEVGEPRFASLQAMMKAGKKPIQRWNASDVDFTPADMITLTDLFEPDLPAIDCQMIRGDDDEDKGRKLAQLFQDQGLSLTRQRSEVV